MSADGGDSKGRIARLGPANRGVLERHKWHQQASFLSTPLLEINMSRRNLTKGLVFQDDDGPNVLFDGEWDVFNGVPEKAKVWIPIGRAAEILSRTNAAVYQMIHRGLFTAKTIKKEDTDRLGVRIILSTEVINYRNEEIEKEFLDCMSRTERLGLELGCNPTEIRELANEFRGKATRYFQVLRGQGGLNQDEFDA